MSSLFAPVVKHFNHKFRPLSDLEIQPVDGLRNPATLAAIAARIRYFMYKCPSCGGLLPAHVTATPHKDGVAVHPFIGQYHLKVPCSWCKTEHGLSDVIRYNAGGVF